MKAAEILGVDAVRFVEPEFAAQTDSRFNALLAETGAMKGGSLLMRRRTARPRVPWTGRLDCRFVPVPEPFGWAHRAVREHERRDLPGRPGGLCRGSPGDISAMSLVAEVPPPIEDLNPTRQGSSASSSRSIWGRGSGETCIDCCCGSGVGSLCSGISGMLPSPMTMMLPSSPGGLPEAPAPRRDDVPRCDWSHPGISTPSPGVSGS